MRKATTLWLEILAGQNFDFGVAEMK